MAQRVKGQEAEVVLIVDGTPENSITAVRSWEFTYQLEILDEGYLGETTNRKDSIYNGISGTIEINIENDIIYRILQQIIDRAKRRTPNVRVNIQFIQNLPNGQRVRHQVPDVEFGEVPVNFASRSDYGAITLPFAASDGRQI